MASTFGRKPIASIPIQWNRIPNGNPFQRSLSPATVSSLKGATGPAGAKGAAGAAGPAGAAGAAGAPGVSGLQYVSASVTIGAGSSNSVTVNCPAGKKILGLSADWSSTLDPTSAAISSTLTGGFAFGKNTFGAAQDLRAHATCAFVS